MNEKIGKHQKKLQAEYRAFLLSQKSAQNKLKQKVDSSTQQKTPLTQAQLEEKFAISAGYAKQYPEEYQAYINKKTKPTPSPQQPKNNPTQPNNTQSKLVEFYKNNPLMLQTVAEKANHPDHALARSILSPPQIKQQATSLDKINKPSQEINPRTQKPKSIIRPRTPEKEKEEKAPQENFDLSSADGLIRAIEMMVFIDQSDNRTALDLNRIKKAKSITIIGNTIQLVEVGNNSLGSDNQIKTFIINPKFSQNISNSSINQSHLQSIKS